MEGTFRLMTISIEELDLAESSDDFTTSVVDGSPESGQIIQFKASNSRCNDHIYGHILVNQGIVKNIYLERQGCSLSRACIVAFSQQFIDIPTSSILSLVDTDFLTAIGATHPMRNDCVLFGVKAMQSVL